MRRDDSIGRISDRNRHNDEIAAKDAEIASLHARIENLQEDLADQTERGDQATTDVHRLRAELAAVRDFAYGASEENNRLGGAARQNAEENERLKEALRVIGSYVELDQRPTQEALVALAALAYRPQGERSDP